MQMAPTAAFVATSCRLTTEHQDRAHDRGFVGPPHHFGDNKDSATKKRSQAESERRKEAGRCFKCSVGDASEAPSLYCPLHGASASRAPNTPTGGRTLAARAACGTELLLSSPIHGPSARRAGGASHQSRRSGGSTRGPVATRRAAAGRRRQAGAIRQWPMLCATTGGGT